MLLFLAAMSIELWEVADASSLPTICRVHQDAVQCRFTLKQLPQKSPSLHTKETCLLMAFVLAAMSVELFGVAGAASLCTIT